MSNVSFDDDDDLIMGGTAETSAYNIPASLLQTFPCLMAEGREALRQQLEFVTSAVLLHTAEYEPEIDNTKAIIDRSKLMNDILTSLYQAAQNLASLERVNLDEEYRKETKQALDEPASSAAVECLTSAECTSE
ncbi:Ff.00g080130.m01.CDS01 [Fusarium sp. VM40]|nr:Ff.00g080130.m01.CDS01 [Fusarium sp. VM40]